ncbi:unnamed protein product [Bursaphelenchus xylophilus]|uniref:(pine wood nematode) hypothetical protein n=1 Tax=Bursaphelenchus xylophilus TaxID=6326 RepID=A0A1I7SWT0_BURXY|nr:unnamed protein product [Bursaphelenchus xylophilus]CAG9099886.1 unnamed protein product [Bursaphelenchus xylophilus]
MAVVQNETAQLMLVSDFPDPTRMHMDAYVYMAGAVVFAVILITLFAMNYMWCECCCEGSRKIRARCRVYDSEFHNSLALMDSAVGPIKSDL